MSAVEAINAAIAAVCVEMDEIGGRGDRWKRMSAEDLAYDLCVCVSSSQERFETAVAASRELRRRGLLRWLGRSAGSVTLKWQLEKVLLDGHRLRQGASTRFVRLRFPRRTAGLLAGIAEDVRSTGLNLRAILRAAPSGRDARANLVRRVRGLGPKQASLFLRRIGFSRELAVLDRHVLDYFHALDGRAISNTTISGINGYELIERRFVRISRSFGYPVGCVDLATWIVVRVAKQEGIL